MLGFASAASQGRFTIQARPVLSSCTNPVNHQTPTVCNLECAVLLSKWLVTLASLGPADAPATPEEKNMLGIVRRMLDETEFAVPIDPSLSGPTSHPHHHSNHQSPRQQRGDQQGQPPGVAPPPVDSPSFLAADPPRLRQLAAAVIRLWAETFKGTHVFELVRVLGHALESYADLLEKQHHHHQVAPHRTPPMAGRLPPVVGLG